MLICTNSKMRAEKRKTRKISASSDQGLRESKMIAMQGNIDFLTFRRPTKSEQGASVCRDIARFDDKHANVEEYQS
jgi:hypothetical protein